MVGYNGQNYYFHVNAIYNNVINHFMNSEMSIQNRGVSLTVGYRFRSLKNKIVWGALIAKPIFHAARLLSHEIHEAHKEKLHQ
jgi:hypothetical protein